jgi:hypothetical protein
MKRSILLCIAVLFVALSAVAVSAQGNNTDPAKPKGNDPAKDTVSPLVATWNIVIAAPGQDMPGTLKIEKTGDVYKGSVVTDLGEAPLDTVKVDGDSFTAGITVNAQGQTMTGTINGKLKDDKLTGEISLAAVGVIPYTGKKP